MADILDEVLRDQSDEKKLYFFKKILPFIIGISILIVIGMVINNWYQDKKSTENKELGDVFIRSLENSDKKTVDEVLSSLSKNHPHSKIAELAMLKRAGARIDNGDVAGAKALFEEIINNENVGSISKSFARISWLSLIIDQQSFTEKEKSTIDGYLKYYTDDSQEFFGTASLLKAIWYTKNDQNGLAKEVLVSLRATGNLPTIIKEQALALLSRLELEKN